MLKTKEISIISNSNHGRHLVTNSVQEKKVFSWHSAPFHDCDLTSSLLCQFSHYSMPLGPVFWLASAVCCSPPGAEQRRGLCSQYHSSQTHLSFFLGKCFHPLPQSFWVCLPFSLQWAAVGFSHQSFLLYAALSSDVYDIFVKSAMTSCRDHFILKQFRWGRSSSGKEEEKQHILWKLVLFCVMDEPTVGTQDVVKTDKGWSFRICSTI